MMMIRILIVSFVVMSFSISHLCAQEESGVINGVYKKKTLREKEPIAYPEVREADVFWAKRVWRIIDVREKMNQRFSYEKEPLIQIIHQAASNGDVTVYSAADLRKADDFVDTLPASEAANIGAINDTFYDWNDETEQDEIRIVSEEFDPSKVVKYKVKEDWFFNKATSTFHVRILGIAPVMEVFDEDDNYLGDETIYWVYYPSLRSTLAKHQVYNPNNDALVVSWEDLLEMRYFSSYIYKMSNVADASIQEGATGKDILYISEGYKEDLRNFEHDLWTY